MDHKPNTFALRYNSDKASPYQLRYLTFSSQFASDFQHLLEKESLAADALSRISDIDILAAVNFSVIAVAQKDDAVLHILQSAFKYKLKEFPIFDSASSIYWDMFKNGPKAYISTAFRKVVFLSVRDLAYLDIRTTKRLESLASISRRP